MTRYFLGVDIGSTKSHALIADETGQALGFGKAGPGNHEVVGYEGLQATLKEITWQALESAGLVTEHIAGAGFGVSGYDWPSERASTLEAIQVLGLQSPAEVVNDTIIGLVAGAKDGWGIAVVAGTGENCWGWDRQHRIGRVTGNGSAMGEYGGGWSVVVKAVQAIATAWSRRGQDTSLAQIFMEMTGAPDIASLLEGIALDRYHINADAARLVFKAAEQGDQVASEIIHWAGTELGSLANGVIHQLGFEDQSFDVVMIGSLFDGGRLLTQPMQDTICALAPGARFIRLNTPPVTGAVLLGMKISGLDSEPIRKQLITTVSRFT